MISVKKRWLLVCAAIIGSIAAPVVAQAPTEDLVPGVLLGSLKESKEFYIGNMLLPIRKYGKNRIFIDQSSVDRRQAQFEANLRTQNLVNELKKDSNGDGRISKDEMKASLEARFNSPVGQNPEKDLEQLDNMLKQSMRHDENGDGYVSIDEIWKIAIRNVRQERWIKYNHLERLLELDPNGDGILTLSELEKVSIKTFEKFDRNNNDWIDFEESLKIKEAGKVARKQRHKSILKRSR